MYTKGKWNIDKELSDGGAPMIVSDTCWMNNKRIIAKVYYHNGSEDPEVYDNAKLITAAPVLLEACKNVLRTIKEDLSQDDTLDGCAIVLEQAIAKVKESR